MSKFQRVQRPQLELKADELFEMLKIKRRLMLASPSGLFHSELWHNSRKN